MALTGSLKKTGSSLYAGAQSGECGVGKYFPIRYNANGTVAEEAERITEEHPQRIVNGWPADQYEWPWIAALLNNGRQFCGGSLIDSKHVLTAAHCVAQYVVVVVNCRCHLTISVVIVLCHCHFSLALPTQHLSLQFRVMVFPGKSLIIIGPG